MKKLLSLIIITTFTLVVNVNASSDGELLLKNNEPSNELYIDAEGDFYPCCWIGTYRYKYKHVFSPKESNFNIKTNSLQSILENGKVKDFFESTKHFTSAHECCKIQCGVKNGK